MGILKPEPSTVCESLFTYYTAAQMKEKLETVRAWLDAEAKAQEL